MNASKLIKIKPGCYRTQDGEYEIRDNYDPSGQPNAREGRGSSIRWTVEFIDTGKIVHHDYTLAMCREWVFEHRMDPTPLGTWKVIRQ